MDRSLVIWFPGPNSYTGEDAAELHLHGGPAVAAAVMEAIRALGPRPAAPGEFTRKAFENGKMDLDQAEAVADLVGAESLAQARQAARQLEGALGRRYLAWRGALGHALAQLETTVDFPEEDVAPDVARGAKAALESVAADLAAALADEARGRRVREGYRVAIMGAPNAGKSSLLNALAGRDAAIVTPDPGATRDVIEVPLDLAGYRVLLADTAGLRSAAAAVEAEGVRRARAWAEAADLRLWVVDRSGADGVWREAAALARPGDLVLLNKADLAAGPDGPAAARAARAAGARVLETTIADPATHEALVAALTARAQEDLAGGDFPAATRLRHRDRLREAHARLASAVQRLEAPELAAEDVRLAIRSLEQVTGKIGAEDILDIVFANFCIGK